MIEPSAPVKRMTCDKGVPRDVSDLIKTSWDKEEKHKPTFIDIKRNHPERILSLPKMIEPPVKRVKWDESIPRDVSDCLI